MTIFIPEYIIYWSDCPNFFFIEYTPAYVFVVDTLFFDNDSYTALYKTGAFSKGGFNKYPRWVHYNFYKAKGRGILRCYLFEKYLCLKKFHYQRKLMFYGLRGYKYCYQWDLLTYQYNNSFGYFDIIKDKPLYAEYGNWWNRKLHPRKWRLVARYHNKVKLPYDEDYTVDTHFVLWEKLFHISMGGLGKQYWVLLTTMLFQNIYNKEWFEETYIYNFYNDCQFWLSSTMSRSIFPIILESYIHFYWILLWPIYMYMFYLFLHFVYDVAFIFFFFNRPLINMFLNIYYWIIEYYSYVRYWLVAIRSYKNSVFNQKDYDLEDILKLKKIVLRNYCYKIFKRDWKITKEEEREFRVLDDYLNYPFILISLFKYKFEAFITFERFLIGFSYFFNKLFFVDLLKKYYLRNFINFFNFILITFIILPFYLIFYFISFLFYQTSFVMFFFRDLVYSWLNGSNFENMYEWTYRDLLFDNVRAENYDFTIHWLNWFKQNLYILYYFTVERKKTIKYYKGEITRHRDITDRPVEEVIEEFENEITKYTLKEGMYGKRQAPFYFWFLSKINGSFVRNKMYFYDHHFENPFFIGHGAEFVCLGFRLRRLFLIDILLNKIYLLHLKNLTVKLSLVSKFWNYFLIILIFYPIYIFFYCLQVIQVLLALFTYENWIIIACKFYLTFIIIKKCLLSFLIVNYIISVLNYFYSIILKFRFFIENYKRNENSLNLSKSFILFYFYFVRYRFIFKIFRIFLVRLWIIGLSLVIIGFFLDYVDIEEISKVWSKLTDFNWEVFFFYLFNPNNSFYIPFKNYLFSEAFLSYRTGYETNMLYNWSIIHNDWLAYIKDWYKLYTPKVHFLLLPFRDLMIFVGLDYKWWFFQLKLFSQMDYGFFRYNNLMFELAFPIFYFMIKKCYKYLIFSYFFMFFDWWYHYFIYSLVAFIENKLNFLFINHVLIFIINIFYNIFFLIKYYYYYYMFIVYKPVYDVGIEEIIDYFKGLNKYFFYMLKYRYIRMYMARDIIMFVEYYWFYCYHYLLYYSYEFIHNFYNYLVFILKFVIPGNFEYSTYNLIGFYEKFNYRVTMPLLVFFHKFLMFFMNSSHTLNTWQQEYPNVYYGIQFPFVSTRVTEFTGSTTLNRFFFETWIIKINLIEDFFLFGWKYNPRFSSGLFLLSFIYISILIYCFVRIFIYASRAFRRMNTKKRLTQSGSRLWYKMRPLESRHLYTDLEYDWAYSWDWIYDFAKYRKDFYPDDPITDGRNDKPINTFEGYYVVYRFLTELFEQKKYQNNKYAGWKILTSMESYYEKRYKQISNIIEIVYHNRGDVVNQSKMFEEVDFIFPMYYYHAEGNAKWRLYNSHIFRYLEMRKFSKYEHWLFNMVMPMLYQYCEDIDFIKYYTQNITPMRRHLWKFETMLNEKDKFRLNFTEFFFTDREFYDTFLTNFDHQDSSTVFGAFIEHRYQNLFNFRPWYDKSIHTLHKPWMFRRFYKVEDYFLKLSQWDEKYFTDLFNLTFYNVFEWPLLLRTKIQLSQLKGLFNAWDSFTMLEETKFLPTNSGIIRGDTETDYEIQQRVNHYWTTVIRRMDDDFHNEIGLFTEKVTPLYSYLFGVYLPLIVVSAQFFDTFSFHSNFLDFLPPLFGYIFSAFRFIDLEFSTWAIHDAWFDINPLMGIFISRDFGISMFLTFMGQGYQPWILFNIDLPKNYQLGIFIYSYSNMNFFPFQEMFSKWEEVYYFYNMKSLPEKMRFWTKLESLIEFPFGYDFYHMEKEFKKERFYFMPIINEIIQIVVIYGFGFLPRALAVLPQALILYVFVVLPFLHFFVPIVDWFCQNDSYYHIITTSKYHHGLFSEKPK